jgi:hypothetical protein
VSTRFLWKDLREGDNSEGVGMDGREYSSGSTRSGTKGMNWIDLPWDRVSLLAVACECVMHCRFCKMYGIS